MASSGVSRRSIHSLRKRSAFVFIFLAALFLTLAPPFQPVLAQTTTATLTGTVFDVSGAVVPKATVTLKNEASGDIRDTVSNAEGYFTFAAVPPGSYTLIVEIQNFSKWEAKAIVLNSADIRNVTGIKLTPGAAKETVVVEATEAQITPTESGDKSVLINEKILQNVAIVGQNAAEFVKIMPGMAYAGGTVNTVWNQQTQNEGTGNGPVGNGFSANGTRQAALDITSDGAHIIDPGCNCGQAMNTNADMTAELKVMTSNFGADEAKGPVVISAIGKSGGQQFHGEAYIYARYYPLNADDAQNKDAGFYPNGTPIAPKAETKYFYPGFNFGGPVILPKSDFNKNRDKLFFFYGMEYYKQDVDNGVYRAVVPSADMRKGLFNDQIANPVNGGGCPDTNAANSSVPGYPYENCYVHYLNGYAVSGLPNANGFTNGVLNYPLSSLDSSGPGLMSVYPLPNIDPSLAASGGFNYASANTRYANMLQERVRVDYNISQSTKLYVSYNHQHDHAEESLDTLWTGNAQSWASPTVPYPTPLIELSTSHVITANLTKVINPTLTNELIFTYTYLNLPNHLEDASKAERGTLGIDYQMLFNHGNNSDIIFPYTTGWSDGIANELQAGFELNGVVFAKKTLPSVADNLIKVWKTHTTKFGFYWERTWNEQPGNAAVNGTAIFSNWGSNSTGNAYSDMLLGQTTEYSEQNFNVTPAFRYMTDAFYVQDSWKISRRFTLEYGMRVSHLGPWVDTTGYGFAAWYPAYYGNGVGGTVNGVTFPGIEWNKVNAATPLSGSASRAFFYDPRLGFAWDLFGSGRTVLRGGYGMYHYHDEQNVQNPAYGVVRGSFSSPTLWSPSFAAIPGSPGVLAPYTGAIPAPSAITALDPNDSQEPRTQTYSFTVAERLPWKSQLEVAYVGSKSDYLSNYNNNFDQINDTTVGSLFTATDCAGLGNPGGIGTMECGWLPNCNPAAISGGTSCSTPSGNYTNGLSGNQVTEARPLWYGACVAAGTCLGTLKIIDHKMYSNYNGLQVTWNKQAGHLTFLSNYTFSKALGIRGENGSATGDPTVLQNNYGTLPNNRTHIFNVAFVYELPGLQSGNKFVKGAVNGWQISGLTQFQSGADLQASVSSNFGYTGWIKPGTTFMGTTYTAEGPPLQATDTNTIGSADITLMPTLTCDPAKGLKSHQYINPNCFSPWVTPGQQGNYIFPTLTGPGFFNSDLSVFKSFQWGKSESKKLTFRFSGYNWLNHPNRTFIDGDPNLSLAFTSTGTLQEANQNFGYATNTIGHRIVQGMVKFSF